MKIITTIGEMRSISAAERNLGRKIAFVPTMGTLHEGHLSLLREGKKRGDTLLLSIYVNPMQFGPTEDLARYPRDLDHDITKAKEVGVDALFLPSDQEIYPEGFSCSVDPGSLAEHLCGASRPGHFRGVATVVAKLFNIVAPDIALFGEKDYQQLAVIRRMVDDLDMPIEIVGCPIVREADGLAMSSRNAFLSPKERKAAASISRALGVAEALVASGERSASSILRTVCATIDEAALLRIDYASLVHPETLLPIAKMTGPSLLALAAFVGKTRLIDNRLFSSLP